jgi:hypothetical protein
VACAGSGAPCTCMPTRLHTHAHQVLRPPPPLFSGVPLLSTLILGRVAWSGWRLHRLEANAPSLWLQVRAGVCVCVCAPGQGM